MYSIILIDSYRIVKNYYPQALLEESKYIVKDKVTQRFITKNWTYFDVQDESEH